MVADSDIFTLIECYLIMVRLLPFVYNDLSIFIYITISMDKTIIIFIFYGYLLISFLSLHYQVCILGISNTVSIDCHL